MTVCVPINRSSGVRNAVPLGRLAVEALIEWRPVPEKRLSMAGDWLAHNVAPMTAWAKEDETPLEARFPGGDARALFPATLGPAFHSLCSLAERAEDICLLYFHCGHQSEAKTPILQKLLDALGHAGPSLALRMRSDQLPTHAFDLVPEFLATHRHVMVIDDPLERLRHGASPAPARPRITLALFGRALASHPRPPRPGKTDDDDPVSLT
jgi:hypothetical protein